MASFTITITYPDGSATRIRDALRAHYGKIEDPVGSGTFRDRTAAECQQAFTAGCKAALKDIVVRTEREAAKAAAEAGVTEPNVT